MTNRTQWFALLLSLGIAAPWLPRLSPDQIASRSLNQLPIKLPVRQRTRLPRATKTRCSKA